MGLALRLNFVDVVCDDSLKNFWANGKKIGYQFDVRLSYYRNFKVTIDQSIFQILYLFSTPCNVHI